MRQNLIEVDEGKRVPDFLNDTIFKGIILDIVVKFEDGSVGNVEVQRYGVAFPSKRAACYSADLVTRQYAVSKGEKKKNVDYNVIQPVYTIIILEISPEEFADSKEYVHHFRQQSDTDVELELLQYYDYVCLDKFKEQKPHVAGELEKWLAFLSIQDTAEMSEFLMQNNSFQCVYDCAILMLKDREELMEMFVDFFEQEDIVGSLNLTNESTIRILTEKNEKLEQTIEEQNLTIEELRKENEQLKKDKANS